MWRAKNEAVLFVISWCLQWIALCALRFLTFLRGHPLLNHIRFSPWLLTLTLDLFRKVKNIFVHDQLI